MRARSLQAWWSEAVNKLFLPKTTIQLNDSLSNNHSVLWKSTKSTEQIKNLGFSHSSLGKESACNAGDPGSIPGSERSLGKGNDNPLQYSCLENPVGRGAWWATVHEVTRVRHDLATKHQPPFLRNTEFWLKTVSSVFLSIASPTCFPALLAHERRSPAPMLESAHLYWSGQFSSKPLGRSRVFISPTLQSQVGQAMD